MQSKAATPEDYMRELPENRIVPMQKLRQTILKNLPKGYEETMSYGMLGYVVPHSIYPDGYHCDTSLPLPFISIASQKNFIGFYHMGIYANPDLLNWFVSEFPKHTHLKLDMGKSCVRFKKVDEIPFKLLGELTKKISVDEWVATYERHLKA